MKILVAALLLVLLSNCHSKVETPNTTTVPPKEELEIDSLAIQQKLAQKTVNKRHETNNGQLVLPFHYEIENNQGTYLFTWDLCDLSIHSDSLNYTHYSFANQIPYKGYIGFEGRLHLVKTPDSTAVTVEKFKEMHTSLYEKIYYSDNESILFKTYSGDIAVLHFTYLKSLKTFAVFYKENYALGFNATEAELLDVAIMQLRTAKNFYQDNTDADLNDWSLYTNALSILDKKVFNEIYTQIKQSVDTLPTDTVYTPQIDGNWDLLSVIPMGDKSAKLWAALNQIEKNRTIDFKKIYYSSLYSQIAFLRSYRENFIQLEYKDDSTIILRKEDDLFPNTTVYAVFHKLIINEKEVILFTGGFSNSGHVHSKEMAYFYANLFKHFMDL